MSECKECGPLGEPTGIWGQRISATTGLPQLIIYCSCPAGKVTKQRYELQAMLEDRRAPLELTRGQYEREKQSNLTMYKLRKRR
jgi:hypothetical protein